MDIVVPLVALNAVAALTAGGMLVVRQQRRGEPTSLAEYLRRGPVRQRRAYAQPPSGSATRLFPERRTVTEPRTESGKKDGVEKAVRKVADGAVAAQEQVAQEPEVQVQENVVQDKQLKPDDAEQAKKVKKRDGGNKQVPLVHPSIQVKTTTRHVPTIRRKDTDGGK